MEELSLIDRFIDEATNMDMANFLLTVLFFYLPYKFSKMADELLLRLVYSGFGIYFLLTMEDVRVIYDLKMLVGLGLVIPQIGFIIQFTKDTIAEIKRMSANTYYFSISVYYKTIRFINWIKELPQTIRRIFTFSDFKQKTNQENQSSNKYHYDKQNDRSSEQKFYEEQKKYHQENSSNQSHNNEERYNRTDNKEEFEETVDDEFTRFESENIYVILGINANDDYKKNKKIIKTLLKKYHPDKHVDDIEFYTGITQIINDAWEKYEIIEKNK